MHKYFHIKALALVILLFFVASAPLWAESKESARGWTPAFAGVTERAGVTE